MNLTIFAVPKSYTGHLGIIQDNAIQSWLQLRPKPKIILLGDGAGTKELCDKSSILHVPVIKKNKYGTPLVNDIFKIGQSVSKTRIITYVNSDIIFTSQLVRSIETVSNHFKNFLIVGKRTDLDIKQPINFSNRFWEKKLLLSAKKNGTLKSGSWIDYFIFTKNLYVKIPPFALGRTFWDKWLIWNALKNNYPVIDITKLNTVIHQAHDYTHVSGGYRNVWSGNEAINNIKFAGGFSCGRSINQSNYFVTKHYTIKKKSFNFFSFSDILFRKFINNLSFLLPLIIKIRERKNKYLLFS